MEIDYLIWLLLAGSCLGYLLEMIWYRKLRGTWINRKGLIYGPFIPIYGIALAGFSILFQKIKKQNLIKIFLIGSIAGSSFEYFSGFLQEKIFGTKSWDYSKKPFQIKGRICLEFAFYWGIAASGAGFVLLPLLSRLMITLKNLHLIPALEWLFLLFLADCLISFLACFRQRLRRQGKPADTRLEEFLDNHYPDERLDAIFTEIRILDQERYKESSPTCTLT